MKHVRKWIVVCAAATTLISGAGLRANEMANCYYDDGCGYVDTCCAPNYAMIGAGLLAVAAVTVAIIALNDDGTTHTTHVHQ